MTNDTTTKAVLEAALDEFEQSFHETEQWLKEERRFEAELKRRPLTTKEILVGGKSRRGRGGLGSGVGALRRPWLLAPTLGEQILL